MKNLIFGIFVTASLFLAACNNNKEARNLYFKAVELYNQGEFESVRNFTDSIKIVNKNAFDEIRAGMQLARKAELAINKRIVSAADSSIKILRKEGDMLLKNFEYVKNEEYQENGYLVYKNDPYKDCQTKSCIRVQITEEGELIMLSVYAGSNAIQHESVKFTASNKEFAMTDVVAYDGARNYRYKINGLNIETITYNEPKTLGIARFIADTKGAPIKVSYDGKKPYSFNLEKITRKAIIESYKFAQLIKHIKEMERTEAIASRTVMVLEKQIREHKQDSI